jgi:hypothetical protein
MTCDQFDHWLDDGMPGPDAASAREHAETCARCAAALRAASEVDALLRAAPHPAPDGFAKRVMDRVAIVSEARARIETPSPSPFAWWVQAAAQPATALAAGLAALTLWQGQALESTAMSMSVGLGQAMSRLGALAPTAAPPFHQPLVQQGLAAAALPLAALASWALYHWLERRALAVRPTMFRGCLPIRQMRHDGLLAPAGGVGQDPPASARG